MNVCLISKYPPIEGGISSQTYWFARELGSRGHKIYVATNANEVEPEYREMLSEFDTKFLSPHNVRVDSSTAAPDLNPLFIPFGKAYAEKLASIAIEIIEKYSIDIIDARYLLPYGVAGHIAKTVTGKPLVLHHAGSDIERLWSSSTYKTLLSSILKSSDRVVSYVEVENQLEDLGVNHEQITVVSKTYVDPSAFNPDVEALDLSIFSPLFCSEIPVITFIGKIPCSWESKGISELLRALAEIKDEFILLMCANGIGKPNVIQEVRKNNLGNRVVFIDFLPPWRMPGLIKASTCVVVPEHDFPIAHHTSNIPLEVISVGKCLILSSEVYAKEPYNNLIHGESVLVVDPTNAQSFSDSLREVIINNHLTKSLGHKAAIVADKVRTDGYIQDILNVYAELL